MSSTSLEAVSVRYGRAAVVFLGGMGVGILPLILVLQFPGLPRAVKIMGLLACLAAYAGTVFVGLRRWAAPRLRYELDDGGLRVFARSGELRDRMPWGDMREYVIDSIPIEKGSRFLRITRTRGAPIRITELRTRAGREAFDAFCGRFLAASAQHRAVEPAARVRGGVSFFDTPAAFFMGVSLMAALALLVVASIILPLGMGRLKCIGLIAGSAPFIWRTVFSRKAATTPAA